ncbi:MAG TPA: hypothetical protein PLU94_00810 [Methanoregulaceae archaeon]|nr:hypothetical protein [Methanoregulaceae archaeon]OPZ43270.1 MAG: hypothetical protein BWY93_01343 [Euryarchaeota archaeon ADurb.BinA087]HPH34012.1 hypothetical protein [Methanoregulaceae archaeon]HPX73408.1 hypothetical protein [Methanoregulaceae archaeon]HQA80503.1 hypothetical protein [Methanoregulaceae archaeon]
MRPTLKEELEFAIWKITGTPMKFSEYTVPYLSQEIAKKTGEDPAVVSLRLIQEIKQIIHEDVDRQLKKCPPCMKQA